MKVVLINIPCSKVGVLSDQWYFPLGLLQIAQVVEASGFDVRVVDGVKLGLTETIKELDGDLVGLSFNSFNLEEMEIVARSAKENGAFVVVGGHAASAIPEALLHHNPNIDAVVVGDGERSVVKLANVLKKGTDISKVPNLVYRYQNEIRHNHFEELPLSSQPIVCRDIGGLNPEDYIKSYGISCSDPIQSAIRPTNVVTRRGCPRRATGNGCSFCARIDKRVRSKTPGQAWDEYRYLVEQLKVNYLFEDSDSWINVPWLDHLATIWERKGGLDAKFRVYGDIRDITRRSVSLLSRLNVDTVLLGIESGDRNVLRKNGKDYSSDDVLHACKLLADSGIKIADAYVLGLARETWGTIDITRTLAENVHSICETSATYWNIMLPLPGSPSWEMLSSVSHRATDMSRGYQLDIECVRSDFLAHCTELGPNALPRLEEIRADLCRQSSMLVGEYIR